MAHEPAGPGPPETTDLHTPNRRMGGGSSSDSRAQHPETGATYWPSLPRPAGPVLDDGGRSHISLRDSLGLTPGSLLRRPPSHRPKGQTIRDSSISSGYALGRPARGEIRVAYTRARWTGQRPPRCRLGLQPTSCGLPGETEWQPRHLRLPMTLEEEWQRWRERYDTTHNGVLRLFHDRAIWRTILAMLEANPAVARGGFGEYWLGSCYTTSQLIGIRGETGTDNKSVGMLRSLNSLASTPPDGNSRLVSTADCRARSPRRGP
jgi:hypothetical protein